MWSYKLLRCVIISALFAISRSDEYPDDPDWVDDTEALDDYEIDKHENLKDLKGKLESVGVDVAGLLGQTIKTLPVGDVGKIALPVVTNVITDTGKIVNGVKGLAENTLQGSLDLVGLITSGNANPVLWWLLQILQAIGVKLDHYYKNEQVGPSFENIDWLKLLAEILKKVVPDVEDGLLKLDIDVGELMKYLEGFANHRFRRSAENVVDAIGGFLGGEESGQVFERLSDNFRALVEELQDANIVKRDILLEYDDETQ